MSRVWGESGLNQPRLALHGAHSIATPGGSTWYHMLNLLVKARVLFKNKISKISIMSFLNPR